MFVWKTEYYSDKCTKLISNIFLEFLKFDLISLKIPAAWREITKLDYILPKAGVTHRANNLSTNRWPSWAFFLMKNMNIPQKCTAHTNRPAEIFTHTHAFILWLWLAPDDVSVESPDLPCGMSCQSQCVT